MGENTQVLDELKDLEGAISLQVTSLDYNLSDEYITLAALTVRMKKGKEEMRAPMDILTANHLKYLQSYDFQWSQYVSPGNNQLTSRSSASADQFLRTARFLGRIPPMRSILTSWRG